MFYGMTAMDGKNDNDMRTLRKMEVLCPRRFKVSGKRAGGTSLTATGPSTVRVEPRGKQTVDLLDMHFDALLKTFMGGRVK